MKSSENGFKKEWTRRGLRNTSRGSVALEADFQVLSEYLPSIFIIFIPDWSDVMLMLISLIFMLGNKKSENSMCIGFCKQPKWHSKYFLLS